MPDNQKVPRGGWKMDAVLASYSVSSSSITSPAEDICASRETLIRRYFEEGFEYRIILCFLYWIHGIVLSLRHLKRLLRRMELRRRRALDAASFHHINLLIRVRMLLHLSVSCAQNTTYLHRENCVDQGVCWDTEHY